MAIQIDKNRLDIDRVRQEMRWEPYKAVAAIVVATAAMAGIIVGVSRIIAPTPPPPPIIIQMPVPQK